ncbi:MAG: hypothetical protein OXO52_22220 [Rhodospirillales bacterium]|nr:hypothetical protein [Rhodospirillales bacterium]
MGLAGQNDALDLRIRQQAVGHDALRQHRAIRRRGMRHGGHRGGLDQRRRVLDRARHPHGARPPGRIGAGVVGGGFGIGGGFDRAGLDDQFRNRPPVVGPPRLGRGYGLRTPARCRLGRDGLAEQVAGRAGRDRCGCDRLPLRHLRDDGIEQLGGVRGAGRPVQLDGGSVAPLQHGEAGVEPGAASCVGAAVDGHGEDAARGRVEAADGVAQHAVGRGDGHEPPARRQHRRGRADVAQVGVVSAAVDPRRRRKRRVHQHQGWPNVAQPVGDGLGVEGGHHGPGKQLGQEPCPDASVLVEVEIAGGTLPEGAFRHHRQHPGAGRGLQHDVAGSDGGGLEGGVGERQRGRELLEPDLLLRAPGVRGLQGRDRFQHRHHAARPVRTGAAGTAHAPAVALEEQHACRLGGLVGVLPDPAALGVGCAEGLGHGVPEDRGIERPAGLQHRQQGLGRYEEGIACRRTGRRCGRVGGEGG